MKANNLVKSISSQSVEISDRIILKSDDGSVDISINNNEVNLSSTGVKDFQIDQDDHGFVVGDLIRVYQDSDMVTPVPGDPSVLEYRKASAASVSTAEAVGIVNSVIDSNSFRFQLLNGIYEGECVPEYDAGTVLFLSEDAGLFTDQDNEKIRKPVGIVLESGIKMVLFFMLGTYNDNWGDANYSDYDYIVSAGDYDELRFIVERTSYEKIFIPNGTYQMSNSSKDTFLSLDRKKILQGESRDGVIFNIDFATCHNVTKGIEGESTEGRESEIRDISFNFGDVGQYLNSRDLSLIYGIKVVERVDFINAYSTDYAIETICIENCDNVNDIIMQNVESGIRSSDKISNIVAVCKRFGDKAFLGLNLCHNIENASLTGFKIGATNSEGTTNISCIDSEKGFYECTKISDALADGDGQNVGFDKCEYLFNASASGQTVGFNECSDLDNCVFTITNSSVQGFSECERLRRCYNTGTGSNIETVFIECENLYDCKASSGNKGFESCKNVSNCTATGMYASGFESCWNIINSVAQNNTYGFYDCEEVVNSKANNSSSSAFTLSKKLVNCYSEATGLIGFNECELINQGVVEDASSSSYLNCVHVSNSESIGQSNGFNGCSFLSNCKGGNGTSGNNGIVFLNCTQLSNCSASNCETGFSNSEFIQGGSVKDTSGIGIIYCNFVGNLDLSDINGAFSITGCSRLTGCRSSGPASINPAYSGQDACKNLVNCVVLGISSIDVNLTVMCEEYTP